MEFREGKNIEFKREFSETFLKTVSAFANYGDGEIFFGIDDEGKPIGISGFRELSLKIENTINDSIDPVPEFSIKNVKSDDKDILCLKIKKGPDLPYFYKNKAYKRSDTATVEVGRTELRRLAIKGSNLNYESLPASKQDLTFSYLEKFLVEKVHIEKLTPDILKTLNLSDLKGDYNIAGELLADNNSLFPAAIDVVKFGPSINQFDYRETIRDCSLLKQFDRALELFLQYYSYEEVRGLQREQIEIIPFRAFKEALANAIIHRVWDVNSLVKISMYDDRLEILSPGGLPEDTSEAEYLMGNVSILRNPIIAGVFFRLGIIEMLGTGIARINKEYKDSLSKPSYRISENCITIILPLVKAHEDELVKEEYELYTFIRQDGETERKKIQSATGMNKAKAVRTLNKLISKGIIAKSGQGPATRYRLK